MNPKSSLSREQAEDQQRRLKETAALVQYIRLLKRIGMRPGWKHLLLTPSVYRDANPV